MLRAENLSMRFMRKTGQSNHFFAVKDVNLELRPGEVALLTGRSGSGKTTLLHMLAGLLTPTGGKVWLDDTDLYSLPDAAL
ncbi:MAG: ATP-binding cassette domain-containing protein, partial [bacterium]